MKCKDIPNLPVLQFLEGLRGRPANWYSLDIALDNSVLHAMPKNTPEKLALTKMRKLIQRGLVDGCACGCRGDFTLTDEGRAFVAGHRRVSTLAEQVADAKAETATWSAEKLASVQLEGGA